MGILDTIASPIESVVKDVENFVAPKTPLGTTPAPQSLIPKAPVAAAVPVRPTPLAPNQSMIPPPAPAGISSLIAKPIGSIVPNITLPKAPQVAPTTVRPQDFKDVVNILPIIAGQFAKPFVDAAQSLSTALGGKPNPINIKTPFSDPEHGEYALQSQTSQKYYSDQLDSGVTPEKAFWNTALKTVGDMTALVTMGRDMGNFALAKTAPESLIDPQMMMTFTRDNLRDYFSGAKSADELQMPQSLRESISDKIANGTKAEKTKLFQGIDMLQAKPSILGKIFGVTQEQADNLLSDLYGGKTRPASAGALPGYAQTGQSPAFGLSTEKVEPVGFHDYEEPTVDSETGQVRQPQTGQDVKGQIARPISDVIGTAKVGDTEIPIGAKGNVQIPETKSPTLFDEPKTKLPVYQGEKDLTTQTLQKLVGRSSVSKTFIENLTNQPDLKQQERDVVRAALKDYPADSQVPVQEFANKVKAELLPLKRKTLETGNYENVSLPDELKGPVSSYNEHLYSSPIKTSAGDVHFNSTMGAGKNNYFGHTRTEDLPSDDEKMPTYSEGTTRRVIEVQSDLYQKGRLEQEATGHKDEFEMRKDLPYKNQDGRMTELQKLGQYNDPTAHFRMVREEIKQAAEDGKTKLQFPTGATAMKIEGLGDRTVWKDPENKAPGNNLDANDLKVGREIVRSGQNGDGSHWIIIDTPQGFSTPTSENYGKFKAVPKDIYDKFQKGEIHLHNEETFDISGKVDTNNPIYRFYEKDLGRYLKKFGAETVTDKQGVTWNEVPITKEMATTPIQAFQLDSEDRTRLRAGEKWTPQEALATVRKFFTPAESEFLPVTSFNKNGLGVKGNVQGMAFRGYDTDTMRFRSFIKVLAEDGKVNSNTVLHEVFEKAVQIAFDDKQFMDVTNKVIRNPLSIFIRDTYDPKAYPTKELRAKELLSDDFAEYMKDKTGYTGKNATLWERLLQFIRRLWRKWTGAEDLYDDLLAGKRMKSVSDLESLGNEYGLTVSNADDTAYPKNEEESSSEQATEKPIMEESNNKSETSPKEGQEAAPANAKQAVSPVESKEVPLPKSMGLGSGNVKRTLISERGPEEAGIRGKTALQEEANKQYLKNESAKVAAELPSKEVMKIRAKENDVKTVYAVGNRAKAESALGQIINEMDASEKGSRTMIGSGPDRTFTATPSTFPKWVPEDLRSRALFDKVIGKTGALNDLHYPDRTVSLREAKLIDAIYNQIDERIGVNTKSLREGITNQYTPEGRLEAKDTEVTNKLLESEYRKTAKMVRDEEAEKQREYRIKKAQDEFDKNAKESNARLAEHDANVKRAIEEATQKEGIVKGFGRKINPVAKLPPATKTIIQKWLANREMAPLKAKEEFEKYPGHEKEGMNTIIAQQDGAKIPYLTQAFENLHTEGRQRGLEIGHQEDYQPQVWKQTPEEINKIIAKRMETQGISAKEIQNYLDGKEKLDKPTAARLKLNPFFTKQKVVPDYRTGIAMGLTPKYDNPVQLIAHYRQNMEVAVANRNLVEALKHNGDLLPTDLNEKPRGFKETSVFGRSYWAPGNLADFLNDYLRNPDDLSPAQKVAHNVAVFNRAVQNIGLMFGIPNTTLQAFPVAMLYSEVMGRGNIKALAPFIRANSNVYTAKWVEANWNTIKQMTEDGITLGALGEGDWSKQGFMDLIKDANIINLKSAGALGGRLFNAGFQAKTFDRMIPMLSVDLYKGIYSKQIAKGVAEPAARKLAADTVKTTYIQRSPQGKTTSELLRSVLYGPVWREQVMKMLGNVAKGYSSEFKNPAYSKSRQLLAGVILTFIAYQIAQKKLSGKYTWENPSGHELDLAVPQKDGSNLYITFFPSLMTVPRLLVGTANALGHGDVQAATSNFSGLLNPNLQTLYSVLENKDYYDRPIYKPTDSATTKVKKLAEYAGSETFEPGFLRYVVGYAEGTNTTLATIAGLTGGIVKYQSATAIQNEQAYNAKTAKTASLAKAKAPLQKIYDSNQILKASGKTDEANKIYDALSPTQKTLYNQIKATEKTKATNARKPAMQQIYDSNQDLKAAGKTEEANAIYSKLSVEDKHVYDLIKKADAKAKAEGE